MKLKMTQFFGEKQPVDQICEEDIITVVSIDKTGKFFCLGDRAGRVIVFEKPETKKSHNLEYGYLTELQSHLKEFDFLKSVDIEEKINCIEWVNTNANQLFLLSSNDKTIKLWKVSDKCIKKSSKTNKKVVNNSDLQLPKLREIESGYIPILKNTFHNLHDNFINSISLLSNTEQMLSSDDVKINLWDLNYPDKNIYTIFDIKPNPLEEESNEYITSTKAHPFLDTICGFSSTKGYVRLIDLRTNSNNDNSAIMFKDKNLLNSKTNFLSSLINSIQDITFSADGNFIFARDFLNVKVWDVKNTKEPLNVIPIYNPIKNKLCELYESYDTYEKFSISSSSCSNYMLTGNFDRKFHIINKDSKVNIEYETNFKKKTMSREITADFNEKISSNYDLDRKILKSTWCHKTNAIVAISLNCIFIYNKIN